MSDMVEHVAKQLFEKGPRGNRPAAIWQLLDDDWKEAFRTTARIAIKAMREPTEAMLQCGFNTHQSWNLGDKDDLAAAWRGMTDEALR